MSKSLFHVPPSSPEPDKKGPAPHAGKKSQVNISLNALQVLLSFWLTPQLQE